MATYQEERFPIPTPRRLIRELRLKRPPWWAILLLIVVVIATWLPLVLLYQARRSKSRLPRVHFIMDMDKQPRFGPQASHPWFSDGRAMRLPVEGTIARGRLMHDQEFLLGYRTNDGTAAGTPTEFVKERPARLGPEDALRVRGKDRYGIYCSICHGDLGAGDGPVSRRALELKEPKWTIPTNLLTKTIRDRADGQIFQAISDGVRNMPSYRSQIPVSDRWAIVAYVRQLQQTQPVVPEPPAPDAAPPAASQTPP